MLRAALLAILIALPANASNCSNKFVKRVQQHAIVKQQAVYPVAAVAAYPVVQNIYYQVGAQVRDYMLAPQAVVQAERGQLEREIGRLQDELRAYNENQQQYAQPQQQQYQPQYAQPYVQPQQQAPCPKCQAWPQQQAACPTCPQQHPAAPPPPQQPPEQLPQLPPAPPAPQQPEQPAEPENPNFSMTAPPDHPGQQSGMLQQHCIKCHSGEKVAKSGLDLSGQLSLPQKMAVLGQVSSGEMPKNGPRLTDTEVRQLAQELLTNEEAQQLSKVLSGQ